jgi:hypothetical protein
MKVESPNNFSKLTIKLIDYFLLAFFLKLISFHQILIKLEEHNHLSKNCKNLINLLKLVFTILLISHLLSCFWIMIAQK